MNEAEKISKVTNFMKENNIEFCSFYVDGGMYTLMNVGGIISVEFYEEDEYEVG